MNRFQSALRSITRDLEAIGARWALVGGMAVSARSQSRFRSDIDVAISVATDEDAEQTIARLLERGYTVAALL